MPFPTCQQCHENIIPDDHSIIIARGLYLHFECALTLAQALLHQLKTALSDNQRRPQ